MRNSGQTTIDFCEIPGVVPRTASTLTNEQLPAIPSKKRGQELIILLAGGDKSTQAKDIKIALRLARNLSE